MRRGRLPQQSVIQALFPGVDAKRFGTRYFPNRPLLRHGRLGRLGPLCEVASRPPRDLIDLASGREVVAYVRMAAGGVHHVRGDRDTARELFDDGATVDLRGLDLVPGVAQQWSKSLADELGLPAEGVSCDGIVSPAGESVPKHFDGSETINVQMIGSKVWELAPCPDIPFPDHSNFPGLRYNWRDLHSGRVPYAPAQSARMPRGSRRTVLKPGSVYFVPRGWWHRTRALEPCFSIVFVLRTVTRHEALITLVNRLRVRPEWREPIPLVTSRQRKLAREGALALVSQAQSDLASVLGSSLFPDPPMTRYRVEKGYRVIKTRRVRGHLLLREPGGSELQIATDAEVARAVLWAFQEKRFTRADAERAWPEFGGGLVARLVAAGILALD